MSRAAQQARGRNDVYALASHPDCFTPYNGRERGVACVVGIGTEHEALFPKRDTKQAIQYARSHRPMLSVDQIPYSHLCADAVVELLTDH